MISGQDKEDIRGRLLATGAVAVGFAKATIWPEEEARRFGEWLSENHHAGMHWLERHVWLRRSLSEVLEKAASIICLAYSYMPESFRDEEKPMIASYAYGKDYHDVIRHRLKPVLNEFKEIYGGSWRICVDSAPVAERYWALKAGIGKKGCNGSVITEKAGALCFLAEVVCTLEIESDTPSDRKCEGCMQCVKACPTGALSDNGTIDARRCISYLTIEHKGDWDESQREIMNGRCYAFGCDECVRVCPHNQGCRPTDIEEFIPLKSIDILDSDSLAIDELRTMDKEEFALRFKGSPIKRCGLDGLKRNMLII